MQESCKHATSKQYAAKHGQQPHKEGPGASGLLAVFITTISMKAGSQGALSIIELCLGVKSP